jgi:hypothetical protein
VVVFLVVTSVAAVSCGRVPDFVEVNFRVLPSAEGTSAVLKEDDCAGSRVT